MRFLHPLFLPRGSSHHSYDFRPWNAERCLGPVALCLRQFRLRAILLLGRRQFDPLPQRQPHRNPGLLQRGIHDLPALFSRAPGRLQHGHQRLHGRQEPKHQPVRQLLILVPAGELFRRIRSPHQPAGGPPDVLQQRRYHRHARSPGGNQREPLVRPGLQRQPVHGGRGGAGDVGYVGPTHLQSRYGREASLPFQPRERRLQHRHWSALLAPVRRFADAPTHGQRPQRDRPKGLCRAARLQRPRRGTGFGHL